MYFSLFDLFNEYIDFIFYFYNPYLEITNTKNDNLIWCYYMKLIFDSLRDSLFIHFGDSFLITQII